MANGNADKISGANIKRLQVFIITLFWTVVAWLKAISSTTSHSFGRAISESDVFGKNALRLKHRFITA